MISKVLVVDDEDRENEGDLIFSAENLTNEQMAMLIRDCSGIVCLCLTDEMATALDLPPMVANNTSSMGTGFTVSIEAKVGVTTGVSAADRVTTVKAAIADGAKPDDLARPGHVFPLRARAGGVLERRGHTEGTVDLMRLAGFKPAGVLCEVTNPDGALRAGMFGRITIQRPGTDSVLAIPRTSISYDSFGTSVFVIQKAEDDAEKQVVNQRFIRIGKARGDFVEVLEGLEEGEQIASGGLLKLRNGAPVIIDNSVPTEPSLNPDVADT